MNANQTTTTLFSSRTADAERVAVLLEMIAVEDAGEILSEQDVHNGSGRWVGTEYTITLETLAQIDEIIAAYKDTDYRDEVE